MAGLMQTTRFRFWRWLICFIGVIAPRRFRTHFLQEWEVESLLLDTSRITQFVNLRRHARLQKVS